MDAFGGCRMIFQADAFSSCCTWSNGTRGEFTSTIGANIFEFISYAACAKGAFVSANARFQGVGGEVLVTQFTVRSNF